MKRKAPHQELTARENMEITADLTRLAWSKFSIVDLRAQRAEILGKLPPEYSEPIDPENLPPVDEDLELEIKNHLRALIDVARRTSGSIDGKHRADITEAVKHQAPMIAGVGLSASGRQDDAQSAQQSGGGGTI